MTLYQYRKDGKHRGREFLVKVVHGFTRAAPGYGMVDQDIFAVVENGVLALGTDHDCDRSKLTCFVGLGSDLMLGYRVSTRKASTYAEGCSESSWLWLKREQPLSASLMAKAGDRFDCR